MAIKPSRRPIAGDRIAATARRLLDASPLCAIAGVDRRGPRLRQYRLLFARRAQAL
jgi:hypothetical protein